MIQGHGDDAYRFNRAIRADFSSNVYGHLDLRPLKEHLARRLDVIGHYPEPEPFTLEAEIAGQLGLEPASVCVTGGATEAIYLTALAFKGSRSAILQPTFNEYADACRLHGHSVCYLNAFPDRLPSDNPVRLLWMCNPNNPTGSVIPKGTLEEWIAGHPDILHIVDQSYGFFTRQPLISPVEATVFPNVLQIHSMTKRYAMPGLRLGYLTGSSCLLDRIRAVRMPWSVNAPAIEAGLYLTAHPGTAPIDLPSLLAEAQRLRDALNGLHGVTVEPTQTHFMLCRLKEGRAADLKDRLVRDHGILIRDASNFEGLDAGCFRIATQTAEDNNLLVDAIRHCLEEGLR